MGILMTRAAARGNNVTPAHSAGAGPVDNNRGTAREGAAGSGNDSWRLVKREKTPITRMQLVEALKGINCQMAGSGESLFTHCDKIAIFFWTILTLSWSEVSTAAHNWTVERTIDTFGRHRNTGRARVMMGKDAVWQ
jgi:hypothetical protein